MPKYKAILQVVYISVAEFDADNDDDAIEQAWDADYSIPFHEDMEEYLDDRDIIHVQRMPD